MLRQEHSAQSNEFAHPDAAVSLRGVHKVYGKGPAAVNALDNVTVDIARGGFTAIMGPSGSGKSTFLHCAAGLDSPTSGSVTSGGTELATMGENQRTKWRRDHIGFIFQAFNLVPALTVSKNVTLPLKLARRKIDRAWLKEILHRVGLDQRAGHRPSQLSGGQQQRVAIARALITRPDVIFGDEPTGALDTVTAKEILALLRRTVNEFGQTAVMVTHDPMAASYADTVLFLADGKIVQRLSAASAEQISAQMTELGAWA